MAVHGLYSSIEKAWERQTDGLPSWPKAQVDNQKLKGRVLLHDYEKSATLDALRTREGVQAEAVRLLEQVLEHRKGQDPVSANRKLKVLVQPSASQRGLHSN